jgi:hypothetical protein
MTDFENQETITELTEQHVDSIISPKLNQEPAINGVPVPELFAAKVRTRRVFAVPHTFQRPTYLRYIEYS